VVTGLDSEPTQAFALRVSERFTNIVPPEMMGRSVKAGSAPFIV
jgi:hypothetical protein